MIFGPDLSALREAAKAQAMNHFVGIAESDGTPATLRALYVMKAAEAGRVQAGGSSALIEGEAALRGVAPTELAQTILDMAKQSSDLELARMKINVQIEAAQTAGEIAEILNGLGFDLKIS